MKEERLAANPSLWDLDRQQQLVHADLEELAHASLVATLEPSSAEVESMLRQGLFPCMDGTVSRLGGLFPGPASQGE